MGPAGLGARGGGGGHGGLQIRLERRQRAGIEHLGEGGDLSAAPLGGKGQGADAEPLLDRRGSNDHRPGEGRSGLQPQGEA